MSVLFQNGVQVLDAGFQMDASLWPQEAYGLDSEGGQEKLQDKLPSLSSASSLCLAFVNPGMLETGNCSSSSMRPSDWFCLQCECEAQEIKG